MKKICSVAPVLATQSYTKNPDSPVGEGVDLQQGDTLSYIMEHEESEHWWLAEDNKGHVVYVPVAYLMIIMDETVREERCDKTGKEGQEKITDGTNIGGEMRHDAERRKTYSTAVIYGIKGNSRMCVGYYTVRKTDTILNKDEGIVVCLPGKRIEHVTQRVEQIHGTWK